MEFPICDFEGKALLFADDSDFVVDNFAISTSQLKKWDGEYAADSLGFIEPLSDRCLRISDIKDHRSCKSVALNTSMEKFPSRAYKANDERFDAATRSKRDMLSLGNYLVSSPESSVSAKQAKVANLQPPLPTCQVFGCNKDLSSSKDYHRRHKVCDAHSKTAVVIVDGIRQRFCQQCSRFHMLAEFDEGKRSCRKRLAGHNKRRRKPQFNTHLGSTYFTADASNSFIFSKILPESFFGLQCNKEATNHISRLIKVEEDHESRQASIDVKLSESMLHFHGMGKQYPSKNCLNTAELYYSRSESHSALSLLSPRKHDLGMPMPHPLTYSSNGDDKVAVDSENPSSEPNIMTVERYLPPQRANTVSLHELSLNLQRVEQQKYYGQIKMENGTFCDSTTA